MAAEDVLRQGTRARLLQALIDLKRPATTGELAAHVGLHRTGVRVHLERLEVAGLVERRRVRQARGRPRDAWSARPDALTGSARPDAYADLAARLAGAISSRPGRLREVEAAGRAFGRELAGGPDLPVEQRLEASFAALGFRPRRIPTPGEACCFELGSCPYRAAVHANQPVVCTFHRGLTEGLLDGIRPRPALRAFVPHDPDEAGCVIEIEHR